MMFLKMFKTWKSLVISHHKERRACAKCTSGESMKLKGPTTLQPPFEETTLGVVYGNCCLSLQNSGITASNSCKFNAMAPVKNKMRKITSKMVLAISTW